MTPPIDNTAMLRPELRAELLRSMKTAIKEALSEPPDAPDVEVPEEDAP